MSPCKTQLSFMIITMHSILYIIFSHPVTLVMGCGMANLPSSSLLLFKTHLTMGVGLMAAAPGQAMALCLYQASSLRCKELFLSDLLRDTKKMKNKPAPNLIEHQARKKMIQLTGIPVVKRKKEAVSNQY